MSVPHKSSRMIVECLCLVSHDRRQYIESYGALSFSASRGTVVSKTQFSPVMTGTQLATYGLFRCQGIIRRHDRLKEGTLSLIGRSS